jgi:transporter family protein
MNYYIFAILAAFFMGLAPIFGKFGLKNVDPAVALSIRSFFISAIMLGWLMLNRDINPVTNISLGGWIFIALEGLCAALLGQLFYYYALKSGDASMVVPLIASFPLFTFIIASIFLGDKVTVTKIAGLGLIIMGVVLIRS